MEVISDEERARRIREIANQVGVDNDPASFERAFVAVAKGMRKRDREDGSPKGKAEPSKEGR
jgi:hypothetical protein